MSPRLFAFMALSAVLYPAAASAQTIDPAFAGDYTYTDIGSITGLPSQYGGLTFKDKDASKLLIGGAANTGAGQIYEVGVVRGAGNHITGFSGPAVPVIAGAFNDGGLAFGPQGVLFLARWPNNELGQTKEASTITDKIVNLGALGVIASPGGLNFVPQGQPNAGKLKIVSWSGGQWYDLTYAPDATGTFDITGATHEVTIEGGPEGFLYVPPGSPQFPDGSVIVSEYSAGRVGTYETDANGDPIVSTRRTFMIGLTGAEGAVTDPQTGDYLFSTFGGGDRVLVVRGFALPLGAPCGADDDCGSEICSDDVCCDAVCEGVCQGCSIATGAPADGICSPADAVACDDEDACTSPDICAAGTCSGVDVECTPSNECHESTGCDVEVGCSEQPRANGAACEGGTCVDGECVLAAEGGGGQGGTGEGAAGGMASGGSSAGGSPSDGAGEQGGAGGEDSGGGGATATPRDGGGCDCTVGRERNRSGWALVGLLAAVAVTRRRSTPARARRR